MITKNIKTFLACCLVGFATSSTLSSCEDMLEMDSDRQVFDPNLDSKTDSIFYIMGTLKGVQEAIDQYVLVNELRGDLLAPTEFADSALTQLYNYTATAANKYDSAYVYYRVINNCNYYVAHRDTTLRTGSRQVAIQEYAEALAIRAWSYMQLAKTYGRVPFYTRPLDNISQGDDITAAVGDYRDLEGIYNDLAPELQKFVGTPVPNYGDINAYDGKTVISQRIMFPVDLVLADLSLETGRYQEAALLYFNYLREQRLVSANRLCGIRNCYDYRVTYDLDFTEDDVPTDLMIQSTRWAYTDYQINQWRNTFVQNPANIPDGEVITYVPMAVNKLQGTISKLPELFGYDQFAGKNNTELYLKEYQLTESEEYKRLSDSQLFYYMVTAGGDVLVADTVMGDQRRWAMKFGSLNTDPSKSIVIIGKYNGANVNIYRTSVIYLRLAECLNRMGYPDAAFAILKDGLGYMAYNEANQPKWTYIPNVLDDGTIETDEEGNIVYADSIRNKTAYISAESYELLTNTLPFLTLATRNILGRAVGIHSHGSGYTMGGNTLYQYQDVLDLKAQEMNDRYGLTLPDSILVDTPEGKKQAVEIVEDLICDEYALEAAFEGHRYGDLLRMARNKNHGEGSDKLFGEGWGNRWLNKKLSFKNTGIDFSNESNWYLPFK